MNSSEVLFGNAKGIEAIQDALLKTLLNLSKEKSIEVSKQPVALDDRGALFDFTNVSLIRFGTSKGIATYGLGFSEVKSLQIWRELFPPKTIEPGSMTRSYEFELMKSYFLALDPTLRSKGFAADPKTIVFQEGANLGGWTKIQVERSVQLPFETPLGVLRFEIPIFDVDYVRTQTLNMYGFKDTARILVVDDSLVSRQHSRSCLAMAGYFNIDEAPDGQSALTRVLGSSPKFELVVADWHMPNMSGFELLKKIRGNPDFKKLPVILVTGEKNKEEIINAIREGVTSYLVKPVAPETFFASLKKAGGRV